MRADTEWQCRQEDTLSLQLRDTRTSSGVVYSSLCTLILLIAPACDAGCLLLLRLLLLLPRRLQRRSSSAWTRLKTLFMCWMWVQDTLGTQRRGWVSSLALRATRWTRACFFFPPRRTNDAVITCFRCACLALPTCSRNVLLQAEWGWEEMVECSFDQEGGLFPPLTYLM